MKNVVNFENDLTKDGDFLFKLWFSIEKETQAKRFQQRLSSPLKSWKFSPNDAKMQEKWDEFSCPYCLTTHAGWMAYLLFNNCRSYNIFDLMLWALAGGPIGLIINGIVDRLYWRQDT